jgi:hypothetical protein
MVSFEVVTELASFGRDQDGEIYTGEVYFVQATFGDGRRYNHNHRFVGCVVEDTEDDPWFDDVREEAMAAAEKLLGRIQVVGKIVEIERWSATYAAYGSSAYSDSEMVAWERSKEEAYC